LKCEPDKIVLIFDTSVVIEFIKSSLLDGLIKYRNKNSANIEMMLPAEVLEELERSTINCNSLHDIFKVVRAEKRIVERLKQRYLGLGDGEIGVLSIALALKNSSPSHIVLLIDDYYARKIAKSLGLDVHGTLWLIQQLKMHNIITKENAIKIVKELPSHGFYIDENTFSQVIETILKDC